jgi:hypothetical protein
MEVYYKGFFQIGICILLMGAFILVPFSASGIALKDSKHNLSASGPGTAKAVTEKGVCVFCHTPHNAHPGYPLWNHEVSEPHYINYWSPTLKSYASPSAAPPVDGFSKLCLGCHDGTVALGATIGKIGTIKTMPNALTPENPGYLGTDLSGGHPISIKFDSQLASTRNSDTHIIMHLRWPIDDKYVKLYSTRGGKGIQCTTCHDPHGGRGNPGEPPFWQKPTHDEVCLVCHDIITPIGH